MTCFHCGWENPPENRHCGNCGAVLPGYNNSQQPYSANQPYSVNQPYPFTGPRFILGPFLPIIDGSPLRCALS